MNLFCAPSAKLGNKIWNLCLLGACISQNSLPCSAEMLQQQGINLFVVDRSSAFPKKSCNLVLGFSFFATASHRCFTITASPSEGIVSAAAHGWRTATDSCSHKSHYACCQAKVHRRNTEKVNACIMAWSLKSSLCVESALKKQQLSNYMVC